MFFLDGPKNLSNSKEIYIKEYENYCNDKLRLCNEKYYEEYNNIKPRTFKRICLMRKSYIDCAKQLKEKKFKISKNHQLKCKIEHFDLFESCTTNTCKEGSYYIFYNIKVLK